jgi:hypothetical protein
VKPDGDDTPRPSPVDVLSDRWLTYYEDARQRRRRQDPRGRTSRAFRQWRRRQRTLLVVGCATLGALIAIFYAILIS